MLRVEQFEEISHGEEGCEESEEKDRKEGQEEGREEVTHWSESFVGVSRRLDQSIGSNRVS
ncbi:MAG: hypothetical protein SFY96_12895 [Planctomycetota bacterium]|nr:hypothetical protein [Planctomycetota bacterium]